jgi:2-isopropylmalate synthase
MFQKVFEDFIALADKKKEVYDSDIAALIEDRLGATNEKWTIVSFHTSAGSGAIPTATLELQCEGSETFRDAATGDGPIDAIFRTMERILGITTKLEDFQVRSVSSGKDALGEVSVVISSSGRKYHGKGVSTDIIEASARAYLKALNKIAGDNAAGHSAAELEGARGV